VTDTYIDGGGVVPDAPLPAGTRIRFSPTGDPRDDITVHVENGALTIAGQYRQLAVHPRAMNIVRVISVRPPY
jgi:hypothetical protein